MATSGLVWGLTSGAAAWFVTRSPFKMDTNTHTFTCSYTALICIKCAFFCLVWGLTFSPKSSCYSDILNTHGGMSFPVSKNDINAVKKEKTIMKCFPQVCCGRFQPHQQVWDELEQQLQARPSTSVLSLSNTPVATWFPKKRLAVMGNSRGTAGDCKARVQQ